MFKAFYNKLLGEYWNPYIAVGLAGILSAFYFAVTGTVWAVTGEFTRFGGHILQFFGVDISNWAYFNLVKMDGTTFTRTDGWIIIGMFAGALITVLLGKNFKIRIPQQKRRLVQGFIGGIIAGFGARMALGCNLAAFFTGIPQFSFHSWIFMVTTGIGTYIGVKIINTSWWRGKPNFQKKMAIASNKTVVQKVNKTSNLQVYLGIIVAVLFAVILAVYIVNGKALLAAAALFGLGFGILIERGQICFTSAFRDLWVSGRAVMTKALAVGVAISVILTFYFIQSGMQALIKVSAPSTAIGGLLFGLGIVLAGGCETGWMYRAMEGQVHFWIVGVGNILGATILAYAWDHLGLYNALTEGWPAINLIEAWGPYQALFGTLLLLAIWFLFSYWWENHYRYGKGLKVEAKKSLATKQQTV
ncbi:selenium metabolism membrane protein YedE/FdhT [Calidifontibacillus erzurumensis]|uniref:Selenium metabolism membrane protein YedE/FdhT n=1 Tax=Calidifontibacillus erzurumensis TaxID=2741433 RepID=A0A8J8KC03_9BACI|nr:selenium metabolism membrane protein YedE/FdhT [Calidifontibacillus erzurumensis]NSL52509.1 selenium metabolism membrane protein YedE/FdhT [Calidifontibacillus erzurumensis]